MENFKRVFVGILVSILTVSILISCGTSTISPEESTKIFLDVILKNDKANMKKIGMKEEDYTKFKKIKEDGIMQEFSTVGIDNSILTDDIKENFKDNILKGLTALTYEVTPISVEKDTAKVSIKIKVFDMDKIEKDGQAKIVSEVAANPNMTEKEIYKESYKIIGDAIAVGTVKEEPKTIEITLNKKSNAWLPTEDDEIKVLSATTEQ